jgi:hypothetical protein
MNADSRTKPSSDMQRDYDVNWTLQSKLSSPYPSVSDNLMTVCVCVRGTESYDNWLYDAV